MDKAIPIEAEEQKCLVQWLRLNNIMHFAPVNENNTFKQNKTYAMIAEQKAKAAGKLKGVSETIVLLDSKILFIELKRKKKVLKNGSFSISHTQVSKEQYDFLTRVSKFDYADSALCYGWNEAREFIDKHRTKTKALND